MCGEVSFSGTSATHKCCHVNMPRSGTSAGKAMQFKDQGSSLSLYTFLPAALWCLSVLWLFGHLPSPHMPKGSYNALLSPPQHCLCAPGFVYTYTKKKTVIKIPLPLLLWNWCKAYQTISTNNVVRYLFFLTAEMKNSCHVPNRSIMHFRSFTCFIALYKVGTSFCKWSKPL